MFLKRKKVHYSLFPYSYVLDFQHRHINTKNVSQGLCEPHGSARGWGAALADIFPNTFLIFKNRIFVIKDLMSRRATINNISFITRNTKTCNRFILFDNFPNELTCSWQLYAFCLFAWELEFNSRAVAVELEIDKRAIHRQIHFASFSICRPNKVTIEYLWLQRRPWSPWITRLYGNHITQQLIAHQRNNPTASFSFFLAWVVLLIFRKLIFFFS